MSIPASAMTLIAMGSTPLGSTPAEYGSIRSAFKWRVHASAIWLRQELPVHKKSTFKTFCAEDIFDFLLRFEFELPEIPCKLCLSLPIERWAIIGVFASLSNLRGKDHTRWLTALATVRLGEEFQDFEYLWLWSTFETGLNFSPSLPDIVDFLPEPFDDFLPFRTVTEGIYADFSRMNRDEFAMQPEGNAGRVIDVLKTPKHCIQIRNH